MKPPRTVTGSAFSLGVALAETAFGLTAGEPRALQRMPIADGSTPRSCVPIACWVHSFGGAGFSASEPGRDTSWLRPTRQI